MVKVLVLNCSVLFWFQASQVYGYSMGLLPGGRAMARPYCDNYMQVVGHDNIIPYLRIDEVLWDCFDTSHCYFTGLSQGHLIISN